MKHFTTQSNRESSGKSNAGFYKRRRGILEHLESGTISLLDLAVHDYLNLKANLVVGNGSSLPPGVCITSATAIHATCPSQIGGRAIQRSLEHLEKIGWIRRWNVRGKRGNYPVLVCRASVHDLSGNEYRVNGQATTDWRNPVLESVGDLSALSSEADAKLSGDREVRTEKRETEEAGAAATSTLRAKERTTRSGKYKEDDLGVSQRRDNRRESSAASAKFPPKAKGRKILKAAWDDVGLGPTGSIKFCEAWESAYEDAPNGDALVDIMERAIQHCQENDIGVPPPFYGAKRRIEKEVEKDKGELPRLNPPY